MFNYAKDEKNNILKIYGKVETPRLENTWHILLDAAQMDERGNYLFPVDQVWNGKEYSWQKTKKHHIDWLTSKITEDYYNSVV